MKQFFLLVERIINRVNASLREHNFSVGTYINAATNRRKMLEYYATYAVTSKHPLRLHFKGSNIAGSYFLGQCHVHDSVVYKSDVRGDELKRKGDLVSWGKELPLTEDEFIMIRNSFLFRTLIHNRSHNIAMPEEMFVRNSVAAHYSNIHGSTLEGCYLGIFSTVDQMSLHSCVVGDFSYLQANELFGRVIKPGTVWIEKSQFSFHYTLPPKILRRYVAFDDNHRPCGILFDFVDSKKHDFDRIYDSGKLGKLRIPASSAVNRFSLIKGRTKIGDNVLVSQRAYLDNAEIGRGSNAQENTFIVDSKLSGYDITAHGAKIIHSQVGENVFVAFNSFLNGKPEAPISIGKGCIIMPHTIIDSEEAIVIPENHLVWGFIGSRQDLATNSVALDVLSESRKLTIGGMTFAGDGKLFVDGFRATTRHILEDNGAFYNKGKNRGHAQNHQSTSINIIQPYRVGPRQGLYPAMSIEP
ncbi:MAG: transferase [Desulfobulbaceae bacterium]|jgi:carbonic anhydrase/acetyltransferase-like protein (isoleucine patch superfamily)|nr:transferase [Desulfobulbaceae bacterium]